MRIKKPTELTGSERRVAELFRRIKREADYPGDVATAILVLAAIMQRRVRSAADDQTDDDRIA